MAGSILMVLDADFRFDPPAPTTKFTYQILVGALEDAGYTVTRAHRGADISAHHQDFLFDGPLDLATDGRKYRSDHRRSAGDQVRGLDPKRVPRWALWARLALQPLIMLTLFSQIFASIANTPGKK